MNLPNKLTMLRVCMVPVFVVLMLADGIPYGNILAGVIFILASLTDTLDGYIARRDNLITDFGKFMDPIADKLLVCSAMICLVEQEKLAAWMVIIIIGRELAIGGFRLVAVEKGTVIAASYWGKFKTVSQMIMVIMLIFDFGSVWNMIAQVVTWIAVILTVISLVDYLKTNWSVMDGQM
ncbi:MAG: CDP-diacylglycerol--glycerol-3-phosphate 3-phosphatidyltransferase [Lachnospiraceae bacterium]|nr:CDP-diacylglycerol--glycerol-3-phosphate 3-phosphatidyltransferase [Lachnospiraceae bacterium]MCD7766811.1 CDP-diacylglycerol--glycerol-3-phosphate 3-phosphatidyltransferase [Lachnospiraceae bacterium]